MKKLLLTLLILSGCLKEPDGSVGNACKPDGTCLGQLVCKKTIDRWDPGIVYVCVLPGDPTPSE